MELIKLNRFCFARDATLGRFVLGEQAYYTLELPWRYNRRNVSCIPPGRYVLTLHERPDGRDAVLLHSVPDRTEIMFHSGNYPRDTNGCILPGCGYTSRDTDTQIHASALALDQLYKFVSLFNEVALDVRNYNPHEY